MRQLVIYPIVIADVFPPGNIITNQLPNKQTKPNSEMQNTEQRGVGYFLLKRDFSLHGNTAQHKDLGKTLRLSWPCDCWELPPSSREACVPHRAPWLLCGALTWDPAAEAQPESPHALSPRQVLWAASNPVTLRRWNRGGLPLVQNAFPGERNEQNAKLPHPGMSLEQKSGVRNRVRGLIPQLLWPGLGTCPLGFKQTAGIWLKRRPRTNRWAATGRRAEGPRSSGPRGRVLPPANTLWAVIWSPSDTFSFHDRNGSEQPSHWVHGWSEPRSAGRQDRPLFHEGKHLWHPGPRGRIQPGSYNDLRRTDVYFMAVQVLWFWRFCCFVLQF